MSSLYDSMTEMVADPAVSALIIEEELEPAKGRYATIAPPTYAGESAQDPAKFAESSDVLVPARTESGWHHDYRRDDNGEPRRRPSVIINSLGACADNAETATYVQQERLGVRLPAVVLDGSEVGDDRIEKLLKTKKEQPETDGHRQQITQAVDLQVSSWEAAHRMADSWFMYGNELEAKQQVWAGDSALKQVLLNISHESGDIVYQNAPNAAIFGNWLSSGTARRHAIPRAYSCEITGYGASGISKGATKLDPTGGASEASRLRVSASGLASTEGGKGAKKPSEVGFGQVPSKVRNRGYQCELILKQASISLKALDRFVYIDDGDRQKALAAKRVYVLLAIAGHLLAQEDGFLRSECDLVMVDQRWGWRRHGNRVPEPIDPPTLDDTADALRRAVTDAEEHGLVFAEPVRITLSDAQVGLVIDRVLKEGATGAREEE